MRQLVGRKQKKISYCYVLDRYTASVVFGRAFGRNGSWRETKYVGYLTKYRYEVKELNCDFDHA
jgi:prolipoprotein diacylglyceryltransferase